MKYVNARMCLVQTPIFPYTKNSDFEWPPIGKIAAHSAYDMFHGIST